MGMQQPENKGLYLKILKTGRVCPRTDELAEKEGVVPCDKDGRQIQDPRGEQVPIETLVEQCKTRTDIGALAVGYDIWLDGNKTLEEMKKDFLAMVKSGQTHEQRTINVAPGKVDAKAIVEEVTKIRSKKELVAYAAKHSINFGDGIDDALLKDMKEALIKTLLDVDEIPTFEEDDAKEE